MPNDGAPSDSHEEQLTKPPQSRIGAPFPASDPDESGGRDWAVPWILALALHAAALGLVLWLRVPEAAPVPEPELVHIVLSPEMQSGEASKSFSELPPDRADSPPANSDLLSNVTSRARDPEPGGDTPLPRIAGESDAALVPLEPDQKSSSPAAKEDPQPAKPPTPPSESTRQPDARMENSAAIARAESIAAERRTRAASPPATDAGIRVNPGSEGNSDIRQPGMDSDGNAGLTGDISLSTTAWEYAPWMERFSRQLMRHWFAPPAYTLGVLKEGGWCILEVEVSRSGQILHLSIEEQHGHPSLAAAAESAVRALAPMEPLPADFPDPTLMLRLRMIYPRIRPR